MKLNKRFIDALAPSATQKFYFDDECRGLALRITPGGVKSFVLNYSIDGRPHRSVVGRWPELSLVAAREEATLLKQGVRKGDDPITQKREKQDAPLVSDLARDYIEQAAKRKRRRTLENDRSLLKLILPRLGHLKVRSVTSHDVCTFHASLAAHPVNANRAANLVSAMFVYAMSCGYCDSNPATRALVKRFPEELRETWLTLGELRSLEDALDDYADQTAADALRLLICTGSRRNEVLGATWSQFDLTRARWTKPARTNKQKKVSHVPLSSAAMKILARLRSRALPGPYLFPHGSGHRTGLRRPWMQVCKAAGLSKSTQVPGKRRMRTIWKPVIRLHDLRHSFASHLVSAGQSLYLVGKLLGHSTPVTTQRYAHVDDRALAACTNVFANKLTA